MVNLKLKIIAFFNNNAEYAPSERLWVFALLMLSGGYIGGFTYFLRGNIFCNAQTGNLVLLSLSLATWNTKLLSYTLSSLLAYSSGILISEFLEGRINKIGTIKWHTYLVGFEIIIIIIIGFIPENFPYEITHLLVNFITAMQFNTFRKAHGLGIATTFCTNHIRQVGSNFVKYLEKNKKVDLITSLSHLTMIVAFLIGVFLAVLIGKYFLGKAIWLAAVFLFIVFLYFLHTDLKNLKRYKNENIYY